MAPYLSQETRERIVVWKHEQHKTAPEIAELAGCSQSTVYAVLAFERDYGVVNNPFAKQKGRPRALTTTDLNYITSLLEANPALYLDELHAQLLANRDVDVSLATLSRSLRSLALSNKKISKTALERNELLRATWQAEYGDIPAEYFVWLDEASVDDRTNQRKNGWAGIGRACVRRDTFIRGQRYSVLPALTADGIIALDIFEGSVNKDRFIQFLNEELVCFNFVH